MKVVINRCFGGFSLSDEAIEKCIEYGMTVASSYEADNYKECDFVQTNENWCQYYPAKHYYSDPEFRSHPTIIKVIEELGYEKASGLHAKLDIVDIPFDSTSGWYIHDYDGRECINEQHQSW